MCNCVWAQLLHLYQFAGLFVSADVRRTTKNRGQFWKFVFWGLGDNLFCFVYWLFALLSYYACFQQNPLKDVEVWPWFLASGTVLACKRSVNFQKHHEILAIYLTSQGSLIFLGWCFFLFCFLVFLDINRCCSFLWDIEKCMLLLTLRILQFPLLYLRLPGSAPQTLT